MGEMTDMMVDVETTDTNPSCGAIIQLSAVKFNYDTGEVGSVFDRCPMPLPFRRWNDSTRDFWMGQNREVYLQLVARAEPAMQVFLDFTAFALAGAPQGGYRFWAKPISFDWSFVASHYEQFDAPMPFHFRHARDLNTWMAALRGNPQHPNMEAVVPFHGDRHNGLHDCAYQIDMLFAAKAGNFSEVLEP